MDEVEKPPPSSVPGKPRRARCAELRGGEVGRERARRRHRQLPGVGMEPSLLRLAGRGMWWTLLEHVFPFSKRQSYEGSGVPRPADPPPRGPSDRSDQASRQDGTNRLPKRARCCTLRSGGPAAAALPRPGLPRLQPRLFAPILLEGSMLCLGHRRMPDPHISINSDLQGTGLVALARHTCRGSPTGFKFFKIRRKKNNIIQT